MDGAFNVACDCLTFVYNNLEPKPEFDAEQVGPDGQGGKSGGQGSGQSKSDMLNEAAEKMARGDYHGYQEIMDTIRDPDGTQPVKQINLQPRTNDNFWFSDLTPQQNKHCSERQKEFMNNQQKKVGRLTKKDASIVNFMEESTTQVNVGGDVQQSTGK